MRNLYTGNCYECGDRVEAGEGHPHIDFSTGRKRWLVHCMKCVFEGRKNKSKKKKPSLTKDN